MEYFSKIPYTNLSSPKSDYHKGKNEKLTLDRIGMKVSNNLCFFFYATNDIITYITFLSCYNFKNFVFISKSSKFLVSAFQALDFEEICEMTSSK